MTWTMSQIFCIKILIFLFLFSTDKPASVSSLAAAKSENRAALEKFSRKQRSLLHNQGNQCYVTTVLQYLLANEEFRSKALLKLE